MSDVADLPVTLDPEAALPEPPGGVKVSAVILYVMGGITAILAVPAVIVGVAVFFGEVRRDKGV